MARTGQSENQNANATYGGQSQQSFGAAQGDISQFNSNIGKLEKGQNVGANPFQSTQYLSNVNKLQSEGLHTAADTAKSEMARRLHAVGGINGSQTVLGQRDVGLQTGRLADTLSAERSANDYKSNLMWQQYLAGAPLQAAGAEGNLYGTATGGQGDALKNLGNLGTAQYGFWSNIIGSALQGAGSGAGLAAGCWIAAAVFDEDFLTGKKTSLVREWLWTEWAKHFYAPPLLWLYSKVGERASRNKTIVRCLKPLFEIALAKAQMMQEAF